MPHRKAKERKIPVDYVPSEKLEGFRATYTREEFQIALALTQTFYAEGNITVTGKMIKREPFKHIFRRILAEHINSTTLKNEIPLERAKIIAALAIQLTPKTIVKT